MLYLLMRQDLKVIAWFRVHVPFKNRRRIVCLLPMETYLNGGRNDLPQAQKLAAEWSRGPLLVLFLCTFFVPSQVLRGRFIPPWRSHILSSGACGRGYKIGIRTESAEYKLTFMEEERRPVFLCFLFLMKLALHA